jgi:hypothetical protein
MALENIRRTDRDNTFSLVIIIILLGFERLNVAGPDRGPGAPFPDASSTDIPLSSATT